jgi:hypothetical protein
MSNVTQNSRNSGDSRRRRSRGGNNNRNNQQDSRHGGDRGDRGDRDNRGSRGNRNSGAARSEEFRPQAPRPPRGRPPVKLSWWQKLLKAIGLYKTPVTPARPEHKPQGEPRPAKSNTRNARTNEGAGGGGGEASAERPPKREGRGERNRSGERPRGGDRSSVESPRVYVGNLSYDVTEQDLQELFKGVGPVRNVEIVYNRTTHRSKGYGFVEMLHMDEAIRAVEVLHDQHFMGRPLTVSGAKSKGQDEREEREERPAREARPIVVAPIPAPAAAPEDAAEPVAAVEEAAEPTIQTIVENVPAEACEAGTKNEVA